MFTKYVRKESTIDELLYNKSFSLKERKQLSKKLDVVAYDNPECTENPGRWMWYYKSKPNKNTKTRILCGVRCKFIWMPDLIIKKELE